MKGRPGVRLRAAHPARCPADLLLHGRRWGRCPRRAPFVPYCPGGCCVHGKSPSSAAGPVNTDTRACPPGPLRVSDPEPQTTGRERGKLCRRSVRCFGVSPEGTVALRARQSQPPAGTARAGRQSGEGVSGRCPRAPSGASPRLRWPERLRFPFSQYPSLWSVSNGAITPGAPTAAMANGLGAQFFRGSPAHAAPLSHPGQASSSSGSPLYEGAPTATDIPDSQYDAAAQARLLASWTPVSPPSM